MIPSIHTQHLELMRNFFDSGATRDYLFRKKQLTVLKDAINKYEKKIFDALNKDLGKSEEEAYATEVGTVLSEISFASKHLKKWMKPKRISSNLVNFPSSGRIYRSPLGVVCIIGAWNYPFYLLITPLIGAIAGGNCVVLKPSEFAPNTAAVLQEMFAEYFKEHYVKLVQGDGHLVIPELMSNCLFDYIFYTGSTATGKKIYEAAASQLIPVTLEMGGKSPAVVESSADIKIAARRIVLGKFLNAGQTCVAADYVLVHTSVKDKLVAAMIRSIEDFYSLHPEKTGEYGRIINVQQFERIASYLEDALILFGGKSDSRQLYIEPTIIDSPGESDPVMQEEIFGPVLPVITFHTSAEALAVIQQNKDPLAFYLFTRSSENETWWMENLQFGGGCINNTLWHLAHPGLPFGGVGNSGIGRYHGKFSFETFTHSKGVLRSPFWFDIRMKYPPLKGKMKWYKFFMK